VITDLALRIVRRLARAPGLRRLTHVKVLTRFSFALRASLVRERLQFAWLELAAPRPVLSTHHLRDTGVAFAVRHQTPDILALDELFSQHEYEMPQEVEDVLRARRPLRALDLGANIGLFGAWILGRFPDVQITSVEPDPGNARVLAATIAANSGSWQLLEAAGGTRAGTVRFVAGEHATSHVARKGENGIEVPVVDALEMAGDADLLKIDIEGGEWALLDDPRFRRLRAAAVVLEYHPQACPTTDARSAAEERLLGAGYQIVSVRPHAEHGTGLIWALRRPHTRPASRPRAEFA
jgi:FkbM family methyltransferase